ncbi:hypothetical protein Clacol_009558 [Clathrus columnatus]|uniref:Protein kinase domain-containing protein n=1 Tax=Clathrus columnatus TaxID=1419009 RepID=A0AAV5ANE8_9AGAM|nr:hypothetical protein Clacol_009558 [Clathrus columnatus]
MQTPHHVEAEVNTMSLGKCGVSKPASIRDHRVQRLSYTIGNNVSEIILGKGSFSKVYRAVDLELGQVVALKKSRVPLTVKRPVIQYESRILQILQGHPSIPQLIDYGQLEHFEYMSMEVLGPNVGKKVTGSLVVIPVVRIIEQTANLGPGADLESLAYIALFLLRGNLPWHRETHPSKPILRRQVRIQRSKAAVSGSTLVTHFPADFVYLLDYSRSLVYHQKPDYDDLENRFSLLAKSLGGYKKDDLFDWTSFPSVDKTESPGLERSNFNFNRDDNVADYNAVDGKNISERHENSYYGSYRLLG